MRRIARSGALAAVLLAACDGGGAADGGRDGGRDASRLDAPGFDVAPPPPPPLPPTCTPGARFEGDPTFTVAIGERTSGGFVPWADHDVVRTERGGQGGVMILPSVALDPAVAGETACLSTNLENLPDPEFPDRMGQVEGFPGFELAYEYARTDGRLETGVIGDQIGWGGIEGSRMIVRVTVRGADFAAAGSVRVELGPSF